MHRIYMPNQLPLYATINTIQLNVKVIIYEEKKYLQESYLESTAYKAACSNITHSLCSLYRSCQL